MRVNYTDEISEGLSERTKKELGIDTRWNARSGDFSATGMTKERAIELIAEVQALGTPKGYKVFIGALKKHIQVLDGQAPKASGAAQMETLLERYLALEVPNQTLYRLVHDRYFGFHVASVQYWPPTTDREGHKVPAQVGIKGEYVHMGKKQGWSMSWTNSLCYTTPAALLAEAGYFVETKELKAEQDRYLADFLARLKVGDQFLTSGKGHHDRGGWSSRDRDNDAGYKSGTFDLGAAGA